MGKSGEYEKLIYFYAFQKISMSLITGDYKCKIDAKGRLILPSALLRQFPESSQSIVLKRSLYENCLELYPKNVWEEKIKALSKINTYEKENVDFIRGFINGANILEIDGSNRILIPKFYLGHGGIDKEIVLKSMGEYMEMWSPENDAKKSQAMDADGFAALARKVMGRQENNK